MDAEVARKNAAIAAESTRRKAAEEADEKEQCLQRASFQGNTGLAKPGYEVFRGSSSCKCHLIATKQTDRRIVIALRITIGTSKDLQVDAGAYKRWFRKIRTGRWSTFPNWEKTSEQELLVAATISTCGA